MSILPIPPVSGRTNPLLFITSVATEPAVLSAVNVIVPRSVVPSSLVSLGSSDSLSYVAVIVNSIGLIVLYPLGLYVSLSTYEPASSPLNVNTVLVPSSVNVAILTSLVPTFL